MLSSSVYVGIDIPDTSITPTCFWNKILYLSENLNAVRTEILLIRQETFQ